MGQKIDIFFFFLNQLYEESEGMLYEPGIAE